MTTVMRRRAAWAGLAVLAIVLHLGGLGGRSYHHDESIHAQLSYDLLHKGSYRYDPTYHGPLLYFLDAGTYAVLGDGDFTARLPVALAGIFMVVVAFSLRRPFGERAAWWTGLLFTISPIFLYYGRFLRMDVLEAVLASAAMAAWYRIVRGSRGAWLWLGLWTGLAFATKENAYVTVALIGLASAFTALYAGPLRAVPAALRWLWQRRLGALASLAVFALVTIPLYTVGFTRLDDWAFPVRAISYWWNQHSIQRVGGPWWYHLPRLAQYEFLAIAAALAWIIRRRRRLRPIETFLFAFAFGSVGLYCYLGEKTPWLGVHQVWAFIPLAGAQLARTFGRRGRRWSRAVAGVGLVATVVVSLTANFVLQEITPARRTVESIQFVQTCPELKAVVADGLAAAEAEPGETTVAVAGEAAWPLMWYWRRIPVWWGVPARGKRPALVICNPEQEDQVRRAVGPGYSRQRLPLRAWWLMYQRRPTVGEAVRYFFTRRPWGGLGSTDVVVLRRQEAGAQPWLDVEVPRALEQALRVTGARTVGAGWFGEPRGVAAGPAGVAIADAGLNRIELFTAGDKLETADVGGLLDQPESVAWAAPGVLYVADTWHHRVLRVDLDVASSEELTPPDGGWYGPRSVAVGATGAVAVSDTGNKRIVIYDQPGSAPRVIGGEGKAPGRFVEPGGVAWVDNRTIAVCDTGNRRVQLLSTHGRVRRIVDLPGAWSDYYSRPQIAVLGADEWLVSDTPGKALWRYRAGTVSRIDLAGADIQPTGIAWDGEARSLVLGDLSGKVWVLEVVNVARAHGGRPGVQ